MLAQCTKDCGHRRPGFGVDGRTCNRIGDRLGLRTDDLHPVDIQRRRSHSPAIPAGRSIDGQGLRALDENGHSDRRSEEAPPAPAIACQVSWKLHPVAGRGVADQIATALGWCRRGIILRWTLHGSGNGDIETLQRTRRNHAPARAARRDCRPKTAAPRFRWARSAAPGSAPTSPCAAVAWRRSALR